MGQSPKPPPIPGVKGKTGRDRRTGERQAYRVQVVVETTAEAEEVPWGDGDLLEELDDLEIIDEDPDGVEIDFEDEGTVSLVNKPPPKPPAAIKHRPAPRPPDPVAPVAAAPAPVAAAPAPVAAAPAPVAAAPAPAATPAVPGAVAPPPGFPPPTLTPPTETRQRRREKRETERKMLESFIAAADKVVETSVDQFSGSNFYWGLTNDISEGGVFVATIAILKPGAELQLSLTLPDSEEPVRVTGVVRWIRDQDFGAHAPPGYGVQFTDLTPESRARIEAFVRRRDPLFWD